MTFILVLFLLVGKCVSLSDNYFIVQVPEHMKEYKEFRVYWNVPTMQCASKKIPFLDLHEKFGIIQNKGDRFNGDKITILYEPGDFPAIFKNETSGKYRLRNGGVPQEGNLEEHLDAFKTILIEKIPDPYFDGIGIIDFEMFRPVLDQNFGTLIQYRRRSMEIEKELHPWWRDMWIEKEAALRFETGARQFMETTLLLAKQLRPNALWGYYGFPHCFNMRQRDLKEDCVKSVPGENDSIYWLWAESTALFPSLYSSKTLTSSQLSSLIKGRVKETARLRLENTPILPYFWFRYRDAGFLNQEDLSVALKTLYQSQASGLIIWGSSNDVNTVEKCNKLFNYVETVFGPNIAKYTQRTNTIKDSNINNNIDNINTSTEINTNISEYFEKSSTETSTSYQDYYDISSSDSQFSYDGKTYYDQSTVTLNSKEEFNTQETTESSTNIVSENFLSTEDQEDESFINNDKLISSNKDSDYLIIVDNSTIKETSDQNTERTNVSDDYLIIVKDFEEEKVTEFREDVRVEHSSTQSPNDVGTKSLLDDITDVKENEYDYYHENIIETSDRVDNRIYLESHSLIKSGNDEHDNNELLGYPNQGSDYLIVVDNNYKDNETLETKDYKKGEDLDKDYLIIIKEFNDEYNLYTSSSSSTSSPDYSGISKTESDSITTQILRERSTTEVNVDNYDTEDEELINYESSANDDTDNIALNSEEHGSDYLIVANNNFTDVNTFKPIEYTESTDDHLIIAKSFSNIEDFTINSAFLIDNVTYAPEISPINIFLEESTDAVTVSTMEDSFTDQSFTSDEELLNSTKEIFTQTDFNNSTEYLQILEESSVTGASAGDTANAFLNEITVTDRNLDNTDEGYFNINNTVLSSPTEESSTDETTNLQNVNGATGDQKAEDVTYAPEISPINIFLEESTDAVSVSTVDDSFTDQSFTSDEELLNSTEEIFTQTDFNNSTEYLQILEESNITGASAGDTANAFLNEITVTDRHLENIDEDYFNINNTVLSSTTEESSTDETTNLQNLNKATDDHTTEEIKSTELDNELEMSASTENFYYSEIASTSILSLTDKTVVQEKIYDDHVPQTDVNINTETYNDFSTDPAEFDEIVSYIYNK